MAKVELKFGELGGGGSEYVTEEGANYSNLCTTGIATSRKAKVVYFRVTYSGHVVDEIFNVDNDGTYTYSHLWTDTVTSSAQREIGTGNSFIGSITDSAVYPNSQFVSLPITSFTYIIIY